LHGGILRLEGFRLFFLKIRFEDQAPGMKIFYRDLSESDSLPGCGGRALGFGGSEGSRILRMRQQLTRVFAAEDRSWI